MSKSFANRRPGRGGDVETLDKDILPDNAKEIAKEAPQVKSAQWAADEKKKGGKAVGTASDMTVTSLESLSLNDVGTDDADIRKTKKEQKPKVEEKKVEIKRAQKLEIKRPADELATPSPSAASAVSPLSSPSETKAPSTSSSLNAAAPLREGRGLYRQAGGRSAVKAGSARSSASVPASVSNTAKSTAIAVNESPSSSSSSSSASTSSSSHFDVSQCLQWLSSHLSEQSWEDELAEDPEKRNAFVSDVEKKWNELDLEGRGYFTAEHLVQLYWSQSTGKELDDMPEDKAIDKAIKEKAQKMWKEVHTTLGDDEDEDDNDDDNEDDDEGNEVNSGDAEEDERTKIKKAAAKALRKRWAKESITFWKYVNYLLHKADYEQLQVTAPPQPWAKAYYPTR